MENINVMVSIPEENIINALKEADISYWAKSVEWLETKDQIVNSHIYYKTITVHKDCHVNNESIFTLTKYKVVMGLSVMAQKYPHVLASISEGMADGVTGDTLVQLSLFGELIFG